MTFHVGEVDAVVDGHLLAIDSEHVQSQVAARCPSLLPSFVGGSVEDRRLFAVLFVKADSFEHGHRSDRSRVYFSRRNAASPCIGRQTTMNSTASAL